MPCYVELFYVISLIIITNGKYMYYVRFRYRYTVRIHCQKNILDKKILQYIMKYQKQKRYSSVIVIVEISDNKQLKSYSTLLVRYAYIGYISTKCLEPQRSYYKGNINIRYIILKLYNLRVFIKVVLKYYYINIDTQKINYYNLSNINCG